jgi:hypothetical protein
MAAGIAAGVIGITGALASIIGAGARGRAERREAKRRAEEEKLSRQQTGLSLLAGTRSQAIEQGNRALFNKQFMQAVQQHQFGAPGTSTF